MTQAPNESKQTSKNELLILKVEETDLFQYLIKSERIYKEVFDDDFESCMDKTSTKLDDGFKSFSTLTVSKRQIHLTPGTKRNIKEFIQ